MTLIKDAPPPFEQIPPPEPMILVPYVEGMLHTETVDAVRQTTYPYTLWPLDARDPYAYAALLANYWQMPGDLVVVEQDIVAPAGAIEGMLTCEHYWCSHLYDCNNPVPAYGLGLCKISRYVKHAYPSMGEQAARDYHGRANSMHWQGLNERLISLMNHFGHRVHLHEPKALHLHDYGNADA